MASRRWHKVFLRGVGLVALRLEVVVVVFPGVGRTVVDLAALLVDLVVLLVGLAVLPAEAGLAVLLVVVLRLTDSVEEVLRLVDSVVLLEELLRPVDSAALRKVGLAVLPVAVVMVLRPVADMDLRWARRWVPPCNSLRRRSPTLA